MADPKIVTKKTMAKPGTAATRTAPTAAPAVGAPAKKTAVRAASTATTKTGGKRTKGSATPAQERAVSLQGLAQVTADQRLVMIREAAYYKAEKRQFAVGHEADDWAEAEREIDELLAKARAIYGA